MFRSHFTRMNLEKKKFQEKSKLKRVMIFEHDEYTR